MATFAETMLAKYETLLETATGLDSISVDGQSVRYSDVEAKYRYWKREVERPLTAVSTRYILWGHKGGGPWSRR